MRVDTLMQRLGANYDRLRELTQPGFQGIVIVLPAAAFVAEALHERMQLESHLTAGFRAAGSVHNLEPDVEVVLVKTPTRDRDFQALGRGDGHVGYSCSFASSNDAEDR